MRTLYLSSHTHTHTHTHTHQEKKAQEELERQQMRDEEDKEMSLIDNPQLREREGLETMLDILQLVIIDIQPDGDWLERNTNSFNQ